jgi:RISC-loading complex subunit TARBP2
MTQSVANGVTVHGIPNGASTVPPTAPTSVISATMPTKTPISVLQEFCAQRGMTPTYDLIANEGAVHEPIFVYRVVVGEIVATGKGPSKKKAKHCAAQEALEKIREVVASAAGQDMSQFFAKACSKIEIPDSADDDNVPGNPVGGLQEFTQKKLLRPPIYEFISEQGEGPPHCREFVCIVNLGKLKETGIGKSKKTAKRAAAFNMLKKLESEAAKLEEQDNSEECEGTPAVESSYLAMLKDGKKIQTLNNQTGKAVTQFFKNIKAKPGKALTTLHSSSLNAAGLNFIDILAQIADEHTFEVTYVDLPELSVAGQHQCIVQLATMPVAVCHGLGQTKDAAHANAAHNALQYLKIMTKRG